VMVEVMNMTVPRKERYWTVKKKERMDQPRKKREEARRVRA